jgi:hypothetical protein
MWAGYFRSGPARAAPKEIGMNWNNAIRQAHRWLSIVFTLTVIANFAFMALGKPPGWVVYSPLPPLFLMLLTGLYLFALPYVAKRR